MRRRALLVLVLTLGSVTCTDVYNQPPGASSPISPTSPTPTRSDKIEFRVIGSNINTFTPAVVRHTDAVNGITLYNGGLPYFAQFTSLDDNVFVYVEAQAFGNLSTSTLQVQIFVNGRLFREAFAQGFTLNAQAVGTYRR